MKFYLAASMQKKPVDKLMARLKTNEMEDLVDILSEQLDHQ